MTDNVKKLVAEQARDELRNLIAQYTNELLKRGIANGLDKEQRSEEMDAEMYKRLINNMSGNTDVFLRGIALLYNVEPTLGNDRLKQYFAETQKIPCMTEQLERCYSMLNVVNGYCGTPLAAVFNR